MPQCSHNIAVQHRLTSPRPIPPLAVTARQALVSRSASSAPEQAAHSQLHACSHNSSRGGVQGAAMHEQVGNAGLLLHAANAPSLPVQTQPRQAGTSDKMPASFPKSWSCKAQASSPAPHSLPGGVCCSLGPCAESSAGQVLR